MQAGQPRDQLRRCGAEDGRSLVLGELGTGLDVRAAGVGQVARQVGVVGAEYDVVDSRDVAHQGGLLAPPTVPGALVRISDNGQTVTTLPVPGLYQPTGVAVSANGTVYVSNYGDSNTVSSSQPGEIVKITGLS